MLPLGGRSQIIDFAGGFFNIFLFHFGNLSSEFQRQIRPPGKDYVTHIS